MNEKIKVIDLFCGGGGFSRGLLDAGFDVVAAFDNWDVAVNFYRKNIHGHLVENMDLLDPQKVSSRLRQFDCDMIVGGPPCQDFSSAGKRDENGERANLTISFSNIVLTLRPQYFIMENVERAQATKTFARAMDIFKTAGYGLTVRVLDASLCGVPQKRKRIVVFGIMGKKDDVLATIIQRKQALTPTTIRDYYGDKFGINHYYRHPRSYMRRAVFRIDEPSPTVRGVNSPIPKEYPGDPGDTVHVSDAIRPLTTKERSLIQTFPESWDISGNKADIEQIIGNAVPVKLGEFIGECLREYIDTVRISEQSEQSAVDTFVYSTPIELEPAQMVLFEKGKRYQTKPRKPRKTPQTSQTPQNS